MIMIHGTCVIRTCQMTDHSSPRKALKPQSMAFHPGRELCWSGLMGPPSACTPLRAWKPWHFHACFPLGKTTLIPPDPTS
jgi:hypothetical protein